MTARTLTIVATTGAASLALLVVSAMEIPAPSLAEAGRIAASGVFSTPNLTVSCPAGPGASLLPASMPCLDSWTFPTIVLDPVAELGSGPQAQDVASAEPAQAPPSHAR